MILVFLLPFLFPYSFLPPKCNVDKNVVFSKPFYGWKENERDGKGAGVIETFGR